MTAAAEIPEDVAAEWVARWDVQQEVYVPAREERFAVLADLVAAAVDGVAEPVVVDLGCGPGSLAARIAERVPHAAIVGVDADPLLLALARARYGSVATWALADLATPSWTDALPGTIHAAVSTTALHWMEPDRLGGLYATLAERTAPGGILANGDHLGLSDEGLTPLAHAVRLGRAARAGIADREGWLEWWDAALADPRLGRLATDRARPAAGDNEGEVGQAQHHHGSNLLTIDDHVRLLRAAGYAAAGPVWQSGDDQVVVGVR